MKIAEHQSFKGLHINKLREFDKKAIEPCVKELQKLAKKAEITISSDSANIIHSTYQLVRPAIKIAISPNPDIRADWANITYSFVLNKEAIKNKKILTVAKNLVNLKG